MLVNKMAKKYDMVYRDLLEQINRGELTAGAKLPSENELCEQFHVSRRGVLDADHALVFVGDQVVELQLRVVARSE